MSIHLVLANIATLDSGNDIAPLRSLVDALRPHSADDSIQATQNLQALCHVLDTDPVLARALRNYLERVLGSRKLSQLFTDTGITLSIGFWSAMWRSINYKWLPPVVRDANFKDVFASIFNHSDDYQWICAVDDAVWINVERAIGFNRRESVALHTKAMQDLLAATQALSYRISAIGLESELVRNYSAIEEFESPFLRQNVEINDYISTYGLWLSGQDTVREDGRNIDVLLTQCEEVVGKIQRASATQGTSVSLTRLLLRVTQSIDRLRILLSLLDARRGVDVVPVAVRLFKDLVTAENRKHNLSDLVATNTELLALQVTEHAGRTGEHYVANTRNEWLVMMRSAAGAGAIVACLALVKTMITGLPLAPFVYALLNGLNYGLGFILIYMLHFTIATKQPAMTAAMMAMAIDSGMKKLDQLVELAVRMLRSQFIAILGNVALAMPVAYLIAWMWLPLTGHALVDPDKALHVLHDLDPIHSLALFHAAIAGVCLFLAGVISGYYDNKAAYRDVSVRLQQLTWPVRIFGQARWRGIAGYIGSNLGALTGNFFFGVMLGTVGTMGTFFGLPIDVRHITFSSANFAFALVGLDHHLSTGQWILSITGLILIAMTNLAVSFGLALTVALRSRRVNLKSEWSMARMLMRRFFTAPRDFFFPPADVTPLPTLSILNETTCHLMEKNHVRTNCDQG
jgi:site-specific recombinase